MITHMIRRQELTLEDVQAIDFYSNGLAHKAYTHKERIFSVKVNSQFLPTVKRLNLLDSEKSARCPCCGAPSKVILHMMYCGNPVLSEKRDKAISSFEQWLLSMHTDPDIIETFISGLRQGRDSRFDTFVPDDASILIHEAATFQDSIGRLQFHKGRLAISWATAQRHYFDNKFQNSRKQQTKWMTKLITRINKLNMELWENRNSMVQEYKSITARAEEQARLERKIHEEFE